MSKIKNYLNFAHFFAFFIFICIYVHFFYVRDNTVNETYKNILLLIAGYVFGSSSSSKRKDETISELQDKTSDKPVIGDTVETQNITVEQNKSQQ